MRCRKGLTTMHAWKLQTRISLVLWNEHPHKSCGWKLCEEPLVIGFNLCANLSVRKHWFAADLVSFGKNLNYLPPNLHYNWTNTWEHLGDWSTSPIQQCFSLISPKRGFWWSLNLFKSVRLSRDWKASMDRSLPSYKFLWTVLYQTGSLCKTVF